MPRNERFKTRELRQPGPGEYNYAVFTDQGPKYSTRPKPAIDPFKCRTKPGPAEYQPEKPKTDILYSMRQKPTQSMAYLTPGPGNYEDDRAQHYRTIPGSKMGKDMRKSNHFIHNSSHKKQDPGRYDINGLVGQEKMGVPKYSFGKDLRDRDRSQRLPGPGNYDIRTKMSDGVPCYSMPGRRKDLRPKVGTGVPGSGSYDPKNVFSKKNGP